MPKDEWGVKRLCPSCSTRFYDLQRDPMTCPNCGAVFDLDSLTSKKTSSSRADKKEAAPAAAVATTSDETEDAVVLDDDSADEEVDVADELLEDDEDDNVNLDDIADVPENDDDN